MNEPLDVYPLDVQLLNIICNAGFSVYFRGYNAIDSWLTRGRQNSIYYQILTNAGVADLAKLFENLRYPGVNIADAALEYGDNIYYFTCGDLSDKELYFMDENDDYKKDKQKANISFFINNNRAAFSLLEFYRDYQTMTFFDPREIYPELVKIRQSLNNKKKLNKTKNTVTVPLFEILKKGLNLNSGYNHAIMDAALVLAKYFSHDALLNENSQSFDDTEIERQINELIYMINKLHRSTVPGEEEQRLLLSSLMTSANPALGLELLKISGFINKYWHELAMLDEADQAKEFHPEGNAWKHTMETFRYRKSTLNAPHDLRLSLGLLLHDTGKPLAISSGSRHFDYHAELGEIQARKFLGRLGFSRSLTEDVCFLVRNHMLPAALPSLPFFRTEEIMSSKLFPVLMELYRCDESSSFKGMDGYYDSSAVYQSFLRNRHNPYRSADGKKLNRRKIIDSVNNR